jgi:small multidrug resistance family-3 protein
VSAIPVYIGAAFAEIAGCFAFWAWARGGASMLWLLPGLAALAAFAWLLTLSPAGMAGRAFASGRIDGI